MISIAKAYLDKHSFCPPQIPEKINARTGIIIVIPCFNEPGLVTTLNSLLNCQLPDCFTEVIVVINAPENASEEIIFQNEKTLFVAKEWIKKNNCDALKFFLIKNYALPKKHAGVGLARKIGMDEAVSRFAQIGKENGLIVCLDADCTCDKNYLVELEKHFNKSPQTDGCSIYFEHPIDLDGLRFDRNVEGTDKILLINGIIQYELFLRYYRQGLKFSGHPFSFHTIGSSMAVIMNSYCKQGGMNKRKAGEDFYFLQKIIASGNFSELNSTRVIPSPRSSLRVPFGTGRAISEFIQSNYKNIHACHPQTFVDLKAFFAIIPELFYTENCLVKCSSLPEPVKEFLDLKGFETKLSEIRENSSSPEMFARRFFRWFDAFMVLKFAHFARDVFFEELVVVEAAKKLLECLKEKQANTFFTAKELLLYYREMEKNIN